MTAELLANVDRLVELGTEWIAAEYAQPPLTYTGRIEWQREGLRAVHERMEDLKLAHAGLVVRAEGAERWLATARAMRIELRGVKDDLTAEGLEAIVSTQAARGLAADERRIAHDTRTIAYTIRLRRLERFIELAEGQARSLRSALYAVRDERSDLRSQLRAIDLGVEIGEL